MKRTVTILVLSVLCLYMALKEPEYINPLTHKVLTLDEYKSLILKADSYEAYKEIYERTQTLKTLKVKATAYNATVAQCGNDRGITAIGTSVKQGRTLAVSRDLKHLLGARVELYDGHRSLGIYRVEDLMAEHIRGHAIDVYLDKEEDADWFGRRHLTMKVLKT